MFTTLRNLFRRPRQPKWPPPIGDGKNAALLLGNTGVGTVFADGSFEFESGIRYSGYPLPTTLSVNGADLPVAPLCPSCLKRMEDHAASSADLAISGLLDEREAVARWMTGWYRRWCDARAAMNGSTTSEAIRYSHGLRSLDDIAIEAVCNERGAIPPQRQSAP